VAVAFAGVGHGVHDMPHEDTDVLGTHTPPHAWNPGLHANPHVEPSHVDVAFGGATHGEHDAPHVAIDVLVAQVPPHG